MRFDVQKQNVVPSNFSITLQYNRTNQPPVTATRITIDSATLINQVIHIHFLVNPDLRTHDAGLNNHCAVSVKLPISGRKDDDAESTYEVFTFINQENTSQFYLELILNQLRTPNIYDNLDEHIAMFLEFKEFSNEPCRSVKQNKEKNCRPSRLNNKVEKTISKKTQAVKRFREIPTALNKTKLLQVRQQQVLLLKKPNTFNFQMFFKFV